MSRAISTPITGKRSSGRMQVRIDPKLKRQLQIEAIRQGVTMTEATEQAIAFWLKHQSGKQK